MIKTSAVDFGQFRHRPAFFFRLRPISTSANLDVEFWDVEFLDHKGWGPEGWRPQPGESGVPKPGAPKGRGVQRREEGGPAEGRSSGGGVQRRRGPAEGLEFGV